VSLALTPCRCAISALTTRPRTEALIKNMSEVRKGFSVPVTNASLAGQAPQTAKPERMSVDVTASRWLHHNAAHNSGNRANRAKALLGTGSSNSGLNARKPTTPAARNGAADATFLPNETGSGLDVRESPVAQRTTTGAMTSMPLASRSHHVSQRAIKSDHAVDPARHMAPTPTVAPSIALGPRLTIANLITPADVWKTVRRSDQISIR